MKTTNKKQQKQNKHRYLNTNNRDTKKLSICRFETMANWFIPTAILKNLSFHPTFLQTPTHTAILFKDILPTTQRNIPYYLFITRKITF